MGKRLDTVTDYTNNVDQFQEALTHIKSAAALRAPDLHVEVPSPLRKRTMSGQKLAFPPVKLKPSKAFDVPPAIQDALTYAGVSFNQESIEALQDSLVKTHLEREKKLEDHYSSASATSHDRLAERFGRADGDLRSVIDAVYSYTPFAQVRLTNPKLEEEMKSVEKRLQDADHELLDAETNELSLTDPKVRAFISKYGK
jgi:hypothetical protein